MVKWNVIEDLTDDDVAKFTVQRLNDPHEKITAWPPYWYSPNEVGMYDAWKYCFTGYSYSREERDRIYTLIMQDWVRHREHVWSPEQERKALRIAQLAEREERK